MLLTKNTIKNFREKKSLKFNDFKTVRGIISKLFNIDLMYILTNFLKVMVEEIHTILSLLYTEIVFQESKLR